MDEYQTLHLRPHPLSFGDPNGRLFVADGSLYRGVTEQAAEYLIKLFKNGTVQELSNAGLMVDTELTELQLPGFPVVFRHRRIHPVTFPYEWSGEMLRAAGEVILQLQKALSKQGFSLQDAHPYNVLFDGCKPVFVDFGSIVPTNDDTWRPIGEFRRFVMNPLQLMASGRGRIARKLLEDNYTGVEDGDLYTSKQVPYWYHARRLITRNLPPVARSRLRRARNGIRLAFERKVPITATEELDAIISKLEQMSFPSAGTVWSEYQAPLESNNTEESWTPKQKTMSRIFELCRPATVLDVACNSGWYAERAAALGAKVVAFDNDETCINRLWKKVNGSGLSILPLVMDLRNPSPARGLNNGVFEPAVMRFRSDFVFAGAIVHHLVFKSHYSLEQICDALAALSCRWLAVEFVPKEDVFVSQWWSSERYAWYDEEHFAAVLRGLFKTVEVYGSYPAPRKIFLCER